MAIGKVDLVCKTCGKEFSVSCEKHNRREADNWEAWAKNSITECPDCRRAKKEAAELEKIESTIDKYSLVSLTGTEKQIAWAKKIRNDKINGIINLYGIENLTDVFWDIVNQLSSASWWIERRSLEPENIIDIIGNMVSEGK